MSGKSDGRPTTLAELIDRLEELEGPDTTIDFAIAELLQPPVKFGTPAYTRLIDAAVSLVPKGYDWCVYSDGFAGCMPGSTEGCTEADSHGATPAIALCLAVARVKQGASHD